MDCPHHFNARILEDGGDAVCQECGEWVHIDEDTGEYEALTLPDNAPSSAKE